ncbi:VWA domain-containing protein [Pikeienuella piscinae]|uniref:VWA domain-containing protein n=1 Tax=Pikeienuella piscinae TaxID=2748098 RepID=A0A7L5C0W9_9RHOB|nr:VWA domain-containing protein [Pikeienuella piscinae]QIE55794.1 VWA domain-containing protein [Pikeienuella piscinae]
MTGALPPAIRPFVQFAAVLREHRFAVSPDQTIDFIEGVGLLGPRSIEDVRSAARALFAIPPEREAEFDALFRAIFFGQTIAAPAPSEDDDEGETEAHEPGGEIEIEAEEDEEEAGAEATVVERLSHREIVGAEDEALARFARLAPERLPRRRSYRRARARKGDQPDIRRAIRAAARRDGEIMVLPRRRRKERQRRIVLLIDVSASMKAETDAALRFAHALAQAADRVEIFTLGTRLTRITPALAPAGREQALARAASLIADIDGGTRIGDALQAFLAVPRYAGFARGAAVIVLSDGLERGDPAEMVDAVRRLSRAAWTLDWLTPLKADADFAPRTGALSAILPYLDQLGAGGRVEAVADHVLNIARAS